MARARPNTDTAIMLALAHVLITENLHDKAFLDRYTVGFDKLEAYILGRSDGYAEDAGVGGRNQRPRARCAAPTRP